jgi:hypothetical protein
MSVHENNKEMQCSEGNVGLLKEVSGRGYTILLSDYFTVYEWLDSHETKIIMPSYNMIV